MDWNVELDATCSALGTFDGTKYLKDDDCLECVKDLIRYIRRDDDNHTMRRSLGQIGVVRTDLIPILRDYFDDFELFDMCLRLMVNPLSSTLNSLLPNMRLSNVFDFSAESLNSILVRLF